MAEMTATGLQAAATAGAAALLPVGVMECHWSASSDRNRCVYRTRTCRLTQRYAAETGRETLIAPPYWGINTVLDRLPGSFRIRRETAGALLTDIIDSLFTDEFKEVLIVSHHGDRRHNEMIRDVLPRQFMPREDGSALAVCAASVGGCMSASVIPVRSRMGAMGACARNGRLEV